MAFPEHTLVNVIDSPVKHRLDQPSQPFARRRWAWMLGACLSLVFMAGCQQFVILGYLLGGPPSIEPDFDTQTGQSLVDKKKTVLVLCYAPKEIQWDFDAVTE